MKNFLSVVCVAVLVVLVGNMLNTAPAAVEPVSPIVAPQPEPIPDDQGSIGVPVIAVVAPSCSGGVCLLPRRANTDCATCPDSLANGGDCDRAERGPAVRAVAAPLRVAGRAVRAPARLVRALVCRCRRCN